MKTREGAESLTRETPGREINFPARCVFAVRTTFVVDIGQPLYFFLQIMAEENVFLQAEKNMGLYWF